ncbi:dihydrofolate reductase [Roseibium sp. HPY-6]|uniref:dihydrofolate reductase n=1 Tax=Roseibium sp. HPY-6 TaxID=3229852 RepID=UPI00338D5C9F
MPELVLIAAVARNGIIGSDNDMPWKLSSDLKHFKRLTLGKPVIMGRKTFLSFGGRPLPGRPHIVVSRDPDYRADGVDTATSLEAAITQARALADELEVDEVFCIGGGQIYEQAIDQASRLEITEVDAKPDGDTRFPEIDPDLWEETNRADGQRTERDSADFAMVTYRRRA